MEYSNNTQLSRWTKSTGTSQTNVMANKTTPETYSSTRTHINTFAHSPNADREREREKSGREKSNRFPSPRSGMLLFKRQSQKRLQFRVYLITLNLPSFPSLLFSFSASSVLSFASVHHSISYSLPSTFDVDVGIVGVIVVISRTFIMQFLYFHQTNYSTDRHAYHPYKSHGIFFFSHRISIIIGCSGAHIIHRVE